MNASQTPVWIQSAMETSSLTLNVNIITSVRVEFVITIYVLVHKCFQIMQTHRLYPKIQHKNKILIQLWILKKNKKIRGNNKIMKKWNSMQLLGAQR